jgi:hypothetical protein
VTETAKPLSLADPKWLRALIIEVVQTPSMVARPRRLSELGRDVQDRLWSTGVLLGAGSPEAPVAGQTDAERALIQLLRLELQQAAGIVRGLSRQVLDGTRLRWKLGALLAASTGEFGVAAVMDEASVDSELTLEEEERLFEVASAEVLRRAYLTGNPADGLPLHAGLAAIDARFFARLTAAYALHGGPLRPRAEAYARRQSGLKSILVELLAGLFAATDPRESAIGSEWLRGAARQVRGLFLLPDDRRTTLDGLRKPRAVAELLRLAPPGPRLLLLEQLVLAALLTQRWTADMRSTVVASLAEMGPSLRPLESIEACGAAFLMEHREAALALARPGHETSLDHVFQQATDSFRDITDAVAEEIRETGELGVLLARMARGETLTADEKHKMRVQLIDLAKVVPSAAIFAAPGGMLLLPIVLKLLPFDLRPSAFQRSSHASAPPPPRKTQPPNAA